MIINWKNYRPVSILPCRGTYWKSFGNRHTKWVQPICSTKTALLKVHIDILQSLDKNNAIIWLMLDLFAAFGTIDHWTLDRDILVLHFGIAGKPLTWMASYLNNRYQIVCINGELLKPVHIKYSVLKDLSRDQNTQVNKQASACSTNCKPEHLNAIILHLSFISFLQKEEKKINFNLYIPV